MANYLTKLNVARHQLGTALDLFIRDRDPIAVHCLACRGGELIESIADVENVQPMTAHILETMPDLDIKELRRIQRLYWNAFKHMTQRKGEMRDDAAILAAFDDRNNNATLFVGWRDYQAVTQKLPLPAQVFQMWWYALNEEKLAPDANTAVIRQAFPDIAKAGRREQKRRLRRAIEKYRNDPVVMNDPHTEVAPLSFPASIFKTHT
jgi:hypothetical protein